MTEPSAQSPQSAPSGADSRSTRRRARVAGGRYAQDLKDLRGHARSTFSGGLDSLTAMRRLALAELNLSRHAAGRSVVWVAVGAVFGASTWLLLMAAAVVAMKSQLEWSWLSALLISAVVSLVIALVAAFMVRRYFAFTGFKATKHELARFGVGEADDDEDSDRKPSFRALQRRVDRAEAVAEGRRRQTLESFAAAKAQAKAAVTPGRVLAAGAISGYVVGRNKGISGSLRHTGAASRAALYTTDTALRGLSEIASLAASTFAAFKSAEAADESATAADQSGAAAAAADQAATAATVAATVSDAPRV